MASTFWLFGIVWGAIVATLVTLVVTVWEWLENPGGIFRDEDGTHWGFVFDTAVSWFSPTFGAAAVVAAAAHLAWSGARRLWDARQRKREAGD